MAKKAYDLESPANPKEMKEQMTIKEKQLKGITSKELGEKVSVRVSGTIVELSEGYGEPKQPRASIEIDDVSFVDKPKEEKKED